MNSSQLSTLNSLVAYAMENMPGEPTKEEKEVARIVGAAAVIGDRREEAASELESWKRCLDIELVHGDITEAQYANDLAYYQKIYDRRQR